MILKHLTILNYKNIADADLNFSPKINCFVGSNGEGKTNVLDAIHFLSFTRSATRRYIKRRCSGAIKRHTNECPNTSVCCP